MMDFKITRHDLDVAQGDLVLCANDKDAIAQAITIKLKTLGGEWFLDKSIGVPYLTSIFGHKPSERFLREVISAEILSLADVREITDFTARISEERMAFISFVASLNDGSNININESVGV